MNLVPTTTASNSCCCFAVSLNLTTLNLTTLNLGRSTCGPYGPIQEENVPVGIVTSLA
jgi:hypothetical protein